MAFLAQRPNGSWELRESAASPRGPRARTLVSFRRLGPEEIDRAVERSGAGLTPDEVIEIARRAGAPVERPEAEAAAAALLEALARGETLPDQWRESLVAALDPEGAPPEASRRNHELGDARLWVNASLERRGRALQDLLRLADNIRTRRRPDPAPAFPGFSTSADTAG